MVLEKMDFDHERGGLQPPWVWVREREPPWVWLREREREREGFGTEMKRVWLVKDKNVF